MEARSFFENSPMAEITVSGTKEEWEQVVLDLFSLVGYEPLEPASHNLVRMLREQGVR